MFTWVGLAVTALAVAIGFWMVSRKLVTIEVDGDSMQPELAPKTEAVIRRTHKAKLKDIVVVAAPDPLIGWVDRDSNTVLRKDNRDVNHWWIKRIGAVAGELIPGTDTVIPDKHYYLTADNPDGTDSRSMGLCPANQMLGVMVYAWDLDKPPEPPEPPEPLGKLISMASR